MTVSIALLPGDGIGPEVAAAAVEVLNALVPGKLEFTEHPFGGASIDAHGTALTGEVWMQFDEASQTVLVMVMAHRTAEWDANEMSMMAASVAGSGPAAAGSAGGQ